MKYLILLLTFMTKAALAQDLTWPIPKLPEHTRLVSVADNIKHNGILMQIFQVHSLNAPNAVYNQFNSLWRAHYNEVKEATFNQKRILSVHLHKGFSEYLLVLEDTVTQNNYTPYISVIALSPKQHPAEVISHHLPLIVIG